MSKPTPGTLLSDIDGVPVAVVAGGGPYALPDAVEAALGESHPHADPAAIAAAMPTRTERWRMVAPIDRGALADDAQVGWLAPTGTGAPLDVIVLDLDAIRQLAEEQPHETNRNA